jgi:hypothetical protein
LRYHIYSKIGRIEPSNDKDFNQKSCVIGECGYPVNHKNLSERKEKEVKLAKEIVMQSNKKGYSAALVWIQDFRNDQNVENVIEWLRDFEARMNLLVNRILNYCRNS